jgi:hypothetical protein
LPLKFFAKIYSPIKLDFVLLKPFDKHDLMGFQGGLSIECSYAQLLDDVQQVDFLVQLVPCLLKQTNLHLFLFVTEIKAATEHLTTKTFAA